MYIEVSYDEEETLSSKLEFYKLYTNSNIFIKKVKKEESNYTTMVFTISEQDIIDEYAGIDKIVSYDDNSYEVFMFDNAIYVEYNIDDIFYSFQYIIFDNYGESFSYYKDSEPIYGYNMTDNFCYCINGDCLDDRCNNFTSDYDLFNNILNELKSE